MAWGSKQKIGPTHYYYRFYNNVFKESMPKSEYFLGVRAG